MTAARPPAGTRRGAWGRRCAAALGLLFVLPVPGSSAAREADTVKVLTTVLPFRTFVQEVGRNRVEAQVLVPPGANPHTWELLPRQVKTINEADLYVRVGSGVEFEELWEGRIADANERMVLCNASEGIDLLRSNTGSSSTEAGGRRDPHVWLSPLNAARIVANIAACLISIDPSGDSLYTANAHAYAQRLRSLDRRLREMLSQTERPFLVLHPAWGYFAREYGLVQIPIEAEGKEITAKHIVTVVEMARLYGIRTVFVSPHVNPKVAELVADEFGGEVEYADPLAEDYIENLLRFGELVAGSHE
jgi:zinc transport system substrate-binding protein